MNKTPLLLVPMLALAGCAQQHLVNADKAYDRMAYAKAATGYEKALAKIEDRDAALRAADANRRMNQLQKAANWYAYAESRGPLTAEQALHHGQVLQSLGRSEDARKKFGSVLTSAPDDQLALAASEAIEGRNAFFIDTTLFTVTKVDMPGLESVFSATPYKNGFVFAGERSAATQRENPWNGLSFLDLYEAKAGASGSWSSPTPLPGKVNGRYHEGPAVFDASEKVMYFTRSDYYKFRLNKDGRAVSHLKLYRAEQGPDGGWDNIHEFLHNGYEFSTGHAALSTDGGTLYFISDRPGGFGGTDLYSSTREGEGWSAPVNMGPTVNTPGNEMFPTVSGDTLYFASNGHHGVGGLDIFLTSREGDGWRTPENLNYPINTRYDDFALVMAPGGLSGYLSSNRSGADRIHAFNVHEPTLILTGTFQDDEKYLPMAEVEVKLLDLTTDSAITLVTGPDGVYVFNLKKDHDYRVMGGKNGMFSESRDMNTRGQRTSRTYTEDFRLKEVVIDKPIVIENIYYDYDRWDIRPDAAAELSKVARLFIDNPKLSFELSSHTDSRASDQYNLVLSEARAKSAVDYLIRIGVDAGRITAKGYGERRLVNHCKDEVECTEEEHQANRRTEFKVTKVNIPLP